MLLPSLEFTSKLITKWSCNGCVHQLDDDLQLSRCTHRGMRNHHLAFHSEANFQAMLALLVFLFNASCGLGVLF